MEHYKTVVLFSGIIMYLFKTLKHTNIIGILLELVA